MIRLLAAHGAAIDAVGRDGWTPLGLAARQGTPSVVKALLAAGANLFAPSGTAKGGGQTPLEIASLNSSHNQPVLELLRHEVSAAVLDIARARIAAA